MLHFMMTVRNILTRSELSILNFILFTKITSLVTVQTIKTAINIVFDIQIYYFKTKYRQVLGIISCNILFTSTSNVIVVTCQVRKVADSSCYGCHHERNMI